jgi:hypothetical protein
MLTKCITLIDLDITVYIKQEDLTVTEIVAFFFFVSENRSEDHFILFILITNFTFSESSHHALIRRLL